MGQGVNREVRPDWGGGRGRFPVEWHDVRGQAGAKRPIGVRGQSLEEGGERPAEAGRRRVDRGGGTDKVEGHHPSLMEEENVERREA